MYRLSKIWSSRWRDWGAKTEFWSTICRTCVRSM